MPFNQLGCPPLFSRIFMHIFSAFPIKFQYSPLIYKVQIRL